MAGKAKVKAKTKPKAGRRLPWLKLLLPLLALPLVAIGGLYIGAVMLSDAEKALEAGKPLEAETARTSGESASEDPAGTTADPAADTAGQSAEVPAPLVPRPAVPAAPLDMSKLRITDTVVLDGSEPLKNNRKNNILPAVPEEKSVPEVARVGPAAPAPGAAAEPIPQSTAKPKADPAPPVAETETAAATPGKKTAPQPEAIPPLWLRNATTPKARQGQPMIAVVIDDLGPNLRKARRTIALPAPLTLAFLPYARRLDDLTLKSRQAGHELIVHMPMEPEEDSQNPGENALLTELGPEELQRRIQWNLERFTGYVGVNNHMGSKFTTSGPGMRMVMAEMNKRGLLFLDSRTIAESRAEQTARVFGVPFAQRDVFLDNDHKNPASIRTQLAKVEELARSRGYAVAIGHPHDATIEVLSQWLPEARKRGFALVPISEIVKQRLQLVRVNLPAAENDIQPGISGARP